MIRNRLGSEMFGTRQIKTNEYILLAETMTSNGMPTPLALLNIEAIDDLLSIQKLHSIFTAQSFTKTGRKRPNASMLDAMSGRIAQLIEDEKTAKENLKL